MVSEKQKRILRLQRERKESRRQDIGAGSNNAARPNHASWAHRIYHDKYKQLLIISVTILLLSIAVIAHTFMTTGDILYKGVSLAGGITISVGTEGLDPVDIGTLEETLHSAFPDNDLAVREISEFGTQKGFSVEASTKTNARESLDTLSESMLSIIGKSIPDVRDRASVEVTGPALGASFFQQTLKAILVAFVFMGLIVFMYFGEALWQKAVVLIVEAVLIWNASSWLLIVPAILIGALLIVLYAKYSIPSVAVILAAFSTIIFTIAVVDLVQMRISTAGIAAFLMLVGYSVDTDILLSTRVLKNSTGTVYERIVSTFKTGITMTGTTFAAAFVSLIFSQSAVIREIMIIICIGLIADVLFTWVQNAGVLRWHLEMRGRTSDNA